MPLEFKSNRIVLLESAFGNKHAVLIAQVGLRLAFVLFGNETTFDLYILRGDRELNENSPRLNSIGGIRSINTILIKLATQAVLSDL